MGLDSHRENEEKVVATLPNLISLFRGFGGAALGYGLATRNIDPGYAVAAAGALGISDAEGSLISLTNRFKRIQKALRIIPSTLGRFVDPIMDKIFALSVVAGGHIGGEIPLWQAVVVGTAEIATSAATLAIKATGGDPEASKIGKIGMVGRCAFIGLDLTASAVGIHSGLSHNLLADGGGLSAVVAGGIGFISCGELILSDYSQRQQPFELGEAPELG